MNDSVLSLLETDGDVDSKGYKLQIPQRCTTARKGPLILHPPHRSNPPHQLMTNRHALCTPLPPLRQFAGKNRPHYSKRRSLTRFPVLYIRRPIEMALEQLSSCKMSSREFQENVKNLKVLSDSSDPVNLPQLLIRPGPPPTTSSLSPSNHSNNTTITHYNSTSQMNITITISSSQGNTARKVPIEVPREDHVPTSQSLLPPGHAAGERKGGKLPHVHVPLAPPSLNAVLIHQQYPVTANTRIKGMSLH
ncbi:PREDICTED: uncharacterized protein LOC109580504 [Amphimedon queenslandica]|uniref:Uncharacterized protein n=1 Tax=Amphimedon queenslandica TaxID=400682 RepID=A0A1X7VFW0_AMPQE|nr:PREDICTED: uncharacterized protein LOC109580504 [Amphimedon queenslandica]|eukprot:XP_019849328.1 PREDICTED: uncharacterized protein LOC109580504 [Amphimedon queenslandica]